MNFLIESLQNIFDPTPPTFSNWSVIFTILSVIFIAGGIALKVYMKMHKEDKAFKRTFRDFPFKLIVQGALLGLYTFLRYSAVAFLSMRVIMIAIIISMIYTGYNMVNAYTKRYPELQKHEKEKAENGKHSMKKRRK